MGAYTNDEAAPIPITAQITIDGFVVQSKTVEIPANDSVSLFGDWIDIDTSIPHTICATTYEECPQPIATFVHNGESCM